MGLSAFDRLFEAREKERGNETPVKQTFDPLFPVKETVHGHVLYDPMGKHDFKPATGDGEIT